jgi:predicted transcriptional regulator
MQELLSRWTLEAYLSTKPPSPVIELYSNTTVGQALRILASHNITSAPVFEAGTRTYLGFVDLDDVLQLLLNLVNVRELNEDNRVYKLRAAGEQQQQGYSAGRYLNESRVDSQPACTS